MTDNRLRCILAYRLEPRAGGAGTTDDFIEDGMNLTDLSSGSKVEVTILAKYDHASQYETSHGASGDLYGGRDKSYADAVSLVIGKDPPSAVSETGAIGGFRVVQSDSHQVVFGADRDGICLAVVTGFKYPSRVAIAMLTELYSQFSDQYRLQAKSATPNTLTKKSKPMFSSICKKYDDLSSVDKASALQVKIDAVKGTMQGNIATMLQNTEKAENIAQQSDQLTEQASVFKKKSKDLKRQMRCKNLKMTIILGLLIVGILIVILVPLIIRARNAAK